MTRRSPLVAFKSAGRVCCQRPQGRGVGIDVAGLTRSDRCRHSRPRPRRSPVSRSRMKVATVSRVVAVSRRGHGGVAADPAGDEEAAQFRCPVTACIQAAFLRLRSFPWLQPHDRRRCAWLCGVTAWPRSGRCWPQDRDHAIPAPASRRSPVPRSRALWPVDPVSRRGRRSRDPAGAGPHRRHSRPHDRRSPVPRSRALWPVDPAWRRGRLASIRQVMATGIATTTSPPTRSQCSWSVTRSPPMCLIVSVAGPPPSWRYAR